LKKLLLFSFLTLLLISGCAGSNDVNNTSGNDLRKDKSVPEYMSKRSAGRDKPHLVEDDITNQNPNFLDLNRTGNGTEQGTSNTGIDVDKARQVIGKTKGYRPGSVWINGRNHMRVTAYTDKKGKLTERERLNSEKYLQKKLTAALPRYKIDVTVREDR
jgi:hypothetical protein